MGFWSALGSGLRSVGRFAADHWKEIAVVAVSTVVFAAVIVATGGTAALLAPTLLQLAAAGIASGVAGQVTADLLDGRTPTVRDVVKAAVIGGVITVATAGLGRFVPGLSRPLQNQIAQRAVIGGAGTVGGAGAQVMSNAIDGRPLFENVGEAAVRGGLTTLAASEGVRLAAPRIVSAIERRQQARGRGREVLPDPEPVPARLTREQAAERANAAAVAEAQELRSPGGQPLRGSAKNEVARGVAAKTDMVTGETYTGRTGGPLNDRMARVFREQGIDLAALQNNLDAKGLQAAMRNPAVRAELNPRIADSIIRMRPEQLVGTEANGTRFLALPWNCAEMQALNTALARGARPENLVDSTVTARENNPANAGRLFHSCERCGSIHRDLGVFSATDATLAARAATQTGDSTAPRIVNQTVTNDTTVATNNAAVNQPAPKSKGFTKALGGIGE